MALSVTFAIDGFPRRAFISPHLRLSRGRYQSTGIRNLSHLAGYAQSRLATIGLRPVMDIAPAQRVRTEPIFRRLRIRGHYGSINTAPAGTLKATGWKPRDLARIPCRRHR